MDGWTAGFRFFQQHILEMSMNSADYFHFQTLHRPLPLPVNRSLRPLHRTGPVPPADVPPRWPFRRVTLRTKQILEKFMFGVHHTKARYFDQVTL